MMSESHTSEIVEMLNMALKLEHTAMIQYLSHAELIDGLNSGQIIARLKEIADDEKKHQERFRMLIGDYFDATPSMEITHGKDGKTIEEILKINLKDEKDAVDYYTKILGFVREHRESLPYSYLQIEHALRHVIMDEEEHISELRRLLTLKLNDVERNL